MLGQQIGRYREKGREAIDRDYLHKASLQEDSSPLPIAVRYASQSYK